MTFTDPQIVKFHRNYKAFFFKATENETANIIPRINDLHQNLSAFIAQQFHIFI